MADQNKDALINARKTSMMLRSLLISWVELKGDEVELMIGMASEYADSVTECLNNLSGEEENEEVRHG
ncbi:MAG: hypothetical protein LKJ78_08170 [Serratia liquefaciens]|jgi:hypothetical protein|uniref:hypothetical protein n=1 Tax=Serratia proteamaculans TaxID=28151 RepID=UPI0021826598|nr:hypothetical protein [Serratia proteamaculans]MCH4196483.1 hypothetical protein [Serratia liquefaciens]MCH4230804.1 hypothetical protein [Serratia liquefaciens]MCH4262502.1 hypothetical protein [Serratia liquefaciens]MCI1214623.1 hypothetical protein [Serratia liquefaciens]MCI1235977.1 hypothetical protein [Serratia liquefaciens]